jgi:hypothetical protein
MATKSTKTSKGSPYFLVDASYRLGGVSSKGKTQLPVDPELDEAIRDIGEDLKIESTGSSLGKDKRGAYKSIVFDTEQSLPKAKTLKRALKWRLGKKISVTIFKFYGKDEYPQFLRRVKG